MPFDPESFVTERVRAIDASGIRRVFDLAADLEDPINLSIGQPHFDVPEAVKEEAIAAIRKGFNRYTVTQGTRELKERVAESLSGELPNWDAPLRDGDNEILVTSGVSGGLLLALLTCAGPGDEVLLPDPYFVMYRHLVTLTGATAVYVDTYPDFQLTAERVAPLITPRTRMLLFSSPSNPTGVVVTDASCHALAELAEAHGLLLVSDEIYDEFCYEKVPRASGAMHAPSPAAYGSQLLLLRGFSKTYAMTGWRLGYAAGPRPIVDQMTKLQQYTFVCAPSMAQLGGVVALDQDMSGMVEQYRIRRDRVIERLSGAYQVTRPGGAFYAFPEVPPHLGLTASRFVEQAVQRGLLIIPGSVFSNRDTHFRISYACDDEMLEKGLAVLVELAT
ncbi:MAG: aspartate aminotransferase [Phycisphaeraceae bacterium]|nr:aspartate aminotransferase [Phycisphaeraceae bacterium]